MIKVTLPDGRRVEVNTDDPKAAAKIAHEWSVKNPPATLKNRAAGVAGQVLEGVLPGLSGFVRGARETVVNAVQAPFSDKVDFDPVKAYNEGKRFQEGRNRLAAQRNSTASNLATGAGLAAGLVLPAKKIAAGANLFQKAKAAATTSGLYGLLSGAMSSDRDTVAGKAEDAVATGLTGAGVGFAMPYALRGGATVAAPVTRPITDPLKRAAGQASQWLGERLPGSAGRWLTEEGQQLARDPARAAANRIMDADLRGATNARTGQAFTPDEVTEEVRRRQSIGVPAAPADVHESARRSFGAAARAPGPATAAVRRRLDQRQQESTQRVAEGIRDTLGPTANVESQARLLEQEARDAARPLYEISNAQDIPLTQELQELFSRRRARSALGHAADIMDSEGLDPAAMGLIEGADGVWQLGKAPTMQTYDYAKTALDGMVKPLNNPLASSDERRVASGANNIRRRLLEIMDGDGSGPRVPAGPGTGLVPQNGAAAPRAGQLPDQLRLPEGMPKPPPGGNAALPAPGPADPLPGNPFPAPYEAPSRRLFPEAPEGAPSGPEAWTPPPEGLNPFWKPARDAYAGPIQNRNALELGEQMATHDADDIVNRMAELPGSQGDFFRLGHRSALARDVKTLGDWGNAAARVGGSASKRDGLRAAHGPLADDLLDRTGAEHEAHQTWKAVRGNSMTADREAEMAAQDQKIEEAAKGLFQMLAGRPGEGTATALRALRDGDRNAAEVKGYIAQTLGETDIEKIMQAMRDIEAEKARNLTTNNRTGEAAQRAARLLGTVLGTNLIEPLED